MKMKIYLTVLLIIEPVLRVHVSLKGLSSPKSLNFSFEQFDKKKSGKQEKAYEVSFELARLKPKLKLEKLDDPSIMSNLDRLFNEIVHKKKG